MDEQGGGPLVLRPTGDTALARAGRVANAEAERVVFADFLSRKSANTVRRYRADLDRFSTYLAAAGVPVGDLVGDPAAWGGLTWGVVEGFRAWMVQQGDAVNSINARLSTVRVFARLAAKAGVIDERELVLIQAVQGYSHREGLHVDDRRARTRRGTKKAQAVPLSEQLVARLKARPDTPQGWRDRLLLCMLLDHGLRVGEVAALMVGDVDLAAGTMTFYRPKGALTQTHRLSGDTRQALGVWFGRGCALAEGPLLRGTRRGGRLAAAGMSERAITDRVRRMGEVVGIEGLSAHDCRHYWATYWAARVNPFQLKQAGGWKSLATVDRYVEASQIANEGMT